VVQAEDDRLSLFLEYEVRIENEPDETVPQETPPVSIGILETPDTIDFIGASAPRAGNLEVESTVEHWATTEASPSPVFHNERGAAEVVTPPLGERPVLVGPKLQEAQFQLPQTSPEGEGPAPQLPSRLVYEYGYGSESEIVYRRDPDLDNSVDDDSLIATPELNAHVTYRPTEWLETTLEMILEREFPIQEEHRVTLPNGDVEVSENRQLSLQVDQAFARIKNVTDPFEFTLGRLDFEDDRHWLYDTSLDIAQVSLGQGAVNTYFSVGRENLVDPDLLQDTEKDSINTYILYADYRGIEGVKLGAYSIYRDDRDDQEGKPWHLGVRSHGRVSDELSYWSELATLRGSDENSRNYSAYAFDVGGTYRFLNLPYNPNITLGFALATGDGDPDDNKDNGFRQTGLESNESRFAGLSEFKVYGETLDPELSNLKILTGGLGFRPTTDVSIDFVYHKYWLYDDAGGIRSDVITAETNQDPTRSSNDVGDGFDVVLGLRSLFGIRRLGMDLRTGWFFPGDAFRNEQSDGSFSKADKGISLVTKFWW
jgi:alginate production protein